ncbi:hypothetical protein [Marinitenerispora sediminis]|uniref:hypothetical protein n=1 Tax=Marinitenerispora sediminis TaxID=1931232 RepID=UPI0011C05BF4|nr:hypothetical protein [Marinitenerispora sediminis]
MQRLTRIRFLVFPDNGLFRVHGLGARFDRGAAPGLAGGSLLACGPEHLELSTLQGRIEVSVVLEEWDQLPGPDADTGPEAVPWEEAGTATVFLRGYVSVGTDTSGRTLGVRLAGGTGGYHVEVRARRRHAVAARYDHLLQHYRDHGSAEFRRAAESLRGQEEFLLRLSPAGRTSGNDPVRYPTVVSG